MFTTQDIGIIEKIEIGLPWENYYPNESIDVPITPGAKKIIDITSTPPETLIFPDIYD